MNLSSHREWHVHYNQVSALFHLRNIIFLRLNGCKYKLWVLSFQDFYPRACRHPRSILDYYLDYLAMLGVDFSAYLLSASPKEVCGSGGRPWMRVYYILSSAVSFTTVHS